jgi:hypothetical protein
MAAHASSAFDALGFARSATRAAACLTCQSHHLVFVLEFVMSFFKSALVACVMASAAIVLGLLVPVASKSAHAQAVPFPPCVNDYRAEIAAGQRSQYYPRCVDDHGIPGRFMREAPRQDAQPYNCPSGQVFSGGSCITIQNQWSSNWSQCFYRDGLTWDRSWLIVGGSRYLCIKTANTIQNLCCPA